MTIYSYSKGRRIPFVWWVGIVCLSLLALASCSSDTAPSSPSAATLGGAGGPYAVHVFAVTSDGARHRLDFGPATELSGGLLTGDTAGSGTTRPLGLHPLTNFVDGSIVAPLPSASNASSAQQIDSTAWALVERASMYCNANAPQPSNFSTEVGLTPWAAPNVDDVWNWFLFPYYSTLQTCSERLELEENLLCVADQLDGIADAVGMTVWPTLCSGKGCPGPLDYGSEGEAGATTTQALQDAEWDVPPQANSDRFILRDMAIHVLGVLATLDATPLATPSDTLATCDTLFAEAAENGTGQTSPAAPTAIPTDNSAPGGPWAQLVLGVDSNPTACASTDGCYPIYPPSAVPVTTGQGQDYGSVIARSALQLEAQMLRSGGEMLHDLIREGVYADLASAAQLADQQVSPTEGNAVEWGLNPQQGPYGTYAHAARVLAGRWEIGDQGPPNYRPNSAAFNGHGDPACEGVTAINLLPQAYGNDLNARVNDIQIRTKGEALAADLVGGAGLAFPSCASVMSSPSTLRQILVAQLGAQDAYENGLPEPAPGSPNTLVFTNTVNALSPAEVTFGFQYALHTYELLTDSTDPSPCALLPLGNAVNGLSAAPAGAVDSSVSANGGVVVAGGLSRARLKTDPIARAGGLLEASACPDVTTNWNEWGAAATWFTPSLPTELPSSVFHDAFFMGQAFERRLELLAIAAQPVAGADAGDPESVARAGVAELQSWAGSILVHAGSSTPGNISVRVSGERYSDFGLTGSESTTAIEAAIKPAFGFVYGPPWVAECAAGIRTDCPSNFSAWIQTPTAVSLDIPDSTGLVDDNYLYGAIPPVFTLTLPYGGLTNFQPPTGQATAPSTSHFYMIRLHAPGSPGSLGSVLGVIQPNLEPPNANEEYPVFLPVSFVVAPMQTELLHDTFDIGQWVGAAPPGVGNLTAADTPGYCVDGVPRDIFVPLQNELSGATSGGGFETSWQYYLNIAQQAAATADGFAQQLVNLDLQIATNEETAGIQVANTCGDYGELGQLAISSTGQETPATNDETLSNCLQPQNTDLVFMSGVPAPLTSLTGTTPTATAPVTAQGKALTWIQDNVVGCNKPGANDPLCSSTKTSITYNTFNLVPPAPTNALDSACQQLGSVEASRSTGLLGSRLMSVLQDPSFSTSAIEGLVGSLSMNVDPFGRWQVLYGGTVLMSSTPVNNETWPACIPNCDGTNSPPSIPYLLNSTFRDCSLTTSLGNCDTGSATPGQSGQTAELNMLRWRVAGALQLLAASAGGMPSGMFNMPVPVFLLPSLLASGRSSAYFAAGYGGGGFQTQGKSVQDPLGGLPIGSYLVTGGQGTNAYDASVLGTVYDVAPEWTAFTGLANNEMPKWYLALYAPTLTGIGGVTKHTMVSNAATPWSNCSVAKTIDINACASDGVSPVYPFTPQPVSLGQVVGAGATTLDGFQCPTRWGAPQPQGGTSVVPKGSNGVPLLTMVNALKLGMDYADSNMSAQFAPWFNDGITDAAQGQAITQAGAFGFDANPPNWYCPQSVAGGVDAPCTNDCDPSGANDCATQSAWSNSAVPPSARVFAFVNTSPVNGACGAISAVLDAAAVACSVQALTVQPGNVTSLPQIKTPADVVKLQAWLAQMSAIVGASAGSLYAEAIPNSVVTDIATDQVGSGNKSGTIGGDALSMEQSLEGIPGYWARIGSDFQGLSAAISAAELAMNLTNLNAADAAEKVAFQEINVESQMAQATLSFAQGIVNDFTGAVGCAQGNPAQCTATFTNIAFGEQAYSNAITSDRAQLDNLSQQGTTNSSQQQVELQQAIVALDQASAPIWSDVQTSLDNLRTSVLGVMSASGKLRSDAQQAGYQAAIAAGAGSFVVAGQEVAIPVNTVLNRQRSATALRYQNALKNAKTLAYMARRAIEQRIGVPLDAITTPVGPLDPPSSWADKLCSLTGIDYQNLAVPTAADAGGADGGAEQQVITDFADGFIGDYVTELSDFVTYFNVQYPSHEGTDTAVLSLRYDLMNPVPECTSPGANLLYYSGELDHLSLPAGVAGNEQTVPATPGWQLTGCPPGSTQCLEVVSGAVLQPPDGPVAALQNPGGTLQDPVGDAGTQVAEYALGTEGVTYLVDVSGLGGTDEGGTQGSSDGGDGGPAASIGPPGLVYQAVPLNAGNYVLSWWDQARDSSGNLVSAEGGAPLPYIVEVFGPSWTEVANYQNTAFEASGETLWGNRLTLSFNVPQDGTYFIAFGASTPGEGLGSVAVANVQLEAVTGLGGASTYVPTTTSTMVTSYDCVPSASDMRSQFVHNCNSSGTCWYDLSSPIIIDTQQLQNGTSPISNKLAPGNFNFRHVDLAMNLVGTNVHDCANSPTPDCFGSAYIQYTLSHDGTNAGILDWNGNSRVFDFGVANINSGKALALEQYVTLPISSDDQSLLTQPGIQHIELQGRPLDGVYNLRIWDSPALNWNNLQDVQIVLDYLYWSEVIANGNAAVQGGMRRAPTGHGGKVQAR